MIKHLIFILLSICSGPVLGQGSDIQFTDTTTFIGCYATGRYYDSIRQYNRALHFYEICTQKDSTNYDVAYNATRVKYQMGYYLETLKACDRGLAKWHDDWAYYWLRADTKHRLNDFSGAIKDYTKAMKLKPEYSPAFYKQLSVIKQMSKDYSGCYADALKALELGKRDTIVYCMLGWSCQAFNKWEKSKLYYDTAIAMGAQDYIDFIFRGNAKVNLHDTLGALQDYRTAININSGKRNSYLTIAKLEHELHDSLKTLEYLNDAINIDSNFTDAYALRAEQKVELNDYSGASLDYAKLVKLTKVDELMEVGSSDFNINYRILRKLKSLYGKMQRSKKSQK